MKFNEIKKLVGNNHSIKEIKKIIKKIKPGDIKKFLKVKSGGDNLIIKIIKSKLS